MLKYKPILLGKRTNILDIRKVLEKYIISVWIEFCFGNQPNSHENYIKLKKNYDNIKYDGIIFQLPIIGWILRKIIHFIKREEHKKINDFLNMFIKKVGINNSLFSIFKAKKVNEGAFPETIDRMLLNNAFLGIQIFEYLYNNTLELILNIAEYGIDDYIKREQVRSNRIPFTRKWKIYSMHRGYVVAKKTKLI